MITNAHQKRYLEEMKSPVRKALYVLVKDNCGKTAKQYAEVLDKRPSDINRMLRSMENGGLIYSAPLLTNSSVHGWHINSLNMESRKTKLVTQIWDGKLNL